MAIRFTGVTKHGKKEFAPGVAYRFEDPDAEPYFRKAGWAEAYKPSKGETVIEVGIGEVDIDPDTIHNETRLKVADLTLEGEVK